MTKIIIDRYSNFSKSIEEFLNFKLESLYYEAAGKKNSQIINRDSYYITNIYNKGIILFTDPAEKTDELIKFNGILSDILESIYQEILKDREIRENETVENIKRHIHEYMANCRKRLQSIIDFNAALQGSYNIPNTYLPDNRLELLLNSLQKTTQFQQILKKEYKFNAFIVSLYYAFICIVMFIIFLLISLSMIDSITDLLSFLNEIPSLSFHINKTNYCDTSFYYFLKLAGNIFLYLLIILFICRTIYFSILNKKSKEGNVSARFVYAKYRILSFRLLVKSHNARFVYEIINCAESGYPPALAQVGAFYEKGFGKIIKKDKRLALHYYSRAARYIKEAEKRYIILSKDL